MVERTSGVKNIRKYDIHWKFVVVYESLESKGEVKPFGRVSVEWFLCEKRFVKKGPRWVAGR